MSHAQNISSSSSANPLLHETAKPGESRITYDTSTKKFSEVMKENQPDAGMSSDKKTSPSGEANKDKNRSVTQESASSPSPSGVQGETQKQQSPLEGFSTANTGDSVLASAQALDGHLGASLSFSVDSTAKLSVGDATARLGLGETSAQYSGTLSDIETINHEFSHAVQPGALASGLVSDKPLVIHSLSSTQGSAASSYASASTGFLTRGAVSDVSVISGLTPKNADPILKGINTATAISTQELNTTTRLGVFHPQESHSSNVVSTAQTLGATGMANTNQTVTSGLDVKTQSASNFFDLMQASSKNQSTMLSINPSAEHSQGSSFEALERQGTSSAQANASLEAASTNKLTLQSTIRFGNPAWNTMVAERAAQMAGQNIQFAELKLNPEDLGPIQIKVSVSQEQASVAFSASNANVRDALDQTIFKLKDLLHQEGLDLVEAHVGDESGEQRDQADTKAARRETREAEDHDDMLEDNEHIIEQTIETSYGVDSYV